MKLVQYNDKLMWTYDTHWYNHDGSQQVKLFNNEHDAHPSMYVFRRYLRSTTKEQETAMRAIEEVISESPAETMSKCYQNQTVSDSDMAEAHEILEAPEGKPALTLQNVFMFDPWVQQWAEDRNLFAGGTVDGQFKKLGEEFGELAAALAKGDLEEAMDAVGDMDVVLVILAKMLGFTRDQARVRAYNEIKDRTGKMCNGTFVKDV